LEYKGAVRYKKLLHMLIDENRTITDLQRQAGYSANRSTRLRNGIYISFESVEKICRVLECKIDEIMKLATEEVTRNGK
jgi:putative transcriptional regulator